MKRPSDVSLNEEDVDSIELLGNEHNDFCNYIVKHNDEVNTYIYSLILDPGELSLILEIISPEITRSGVIFVMYFPSFLAFRMSD